MPLYPVMCQAHVPAETKERQGSLHGKSRRYANLHSASRAPIVKSKAGRLLGEIDSRTPLR